MGMRLTDLLRLLTPPLFLNLTRRLLTDQQTVNYGLTGDYPDWTEAQKAGSGYDSEIILEKTRQALLKVKNGEAVHERDTVLFAEIDYAWPVLAGLMWVAARSGGQLNVLDFGGSLGSSYFQNRGFLSALPQVRWNIVEQARHVETGKRWFEDDRLRFYPDIAACVGETQPNVILLSSVLQYVEHPAAVVDQLTGLDCGCLIIDRTPFWPGDADRLSVQSVPPSIYPASYPSWIFSRQKFLGALPEDWRVVASFDDPDKLPGPVEFHYQGMILVRGA